MIKILFVCHGNICRSPMAEFVLKDMVKNMGLDGKFYISSAATSTEEIGNGVHPGTINRLAREGISCLGKRAVQMKKSDYEKYDFLIGMDEANIRNMKRIVGDDKENKIYTLLSFSNIARSISDPWYTGDFETTYNDIKEGCKAFLDYLKKLIKYNGDVMML